MKLVVDKLTKDYGSLRALDTVCLTLEEHKIYGLLGRNGAGKTTLLNLIANRTFPSAGTAYLTDYTNAADKVSNTVVYGKIPLTENSTAQSQIFLMSEANYYPETMRILDILRWTQDFIPSFDLTYALKLAERFGLDTNSKVKSLSTGYSSIFKLIIALSVNVPFVFFDEPVLGLDANHRDLFYRILLERYTESRSTFVISTHLIDEVANVLENVIIIKEGKILYNEPMENFISRAFAVSGNAGDVDRVIDGMNIISTEVLGGLKVAYVMGTAPNPVPAGITVTAPDLQKLFIQLTNERSLS